MYFTEEEKTCESIIGSNLHHFNQGKRKGNIAVSFYVDNGNKADIKKDGKTIAAGLDIKTAMFCTAAIINYMEG